MFLFSTNREILTSISMPHRVSPLEISSVGSELFLASTENILYKMTLSNVTAEMEQLVDTNTHPLYPTCDGPTILTKLCNIKSLCNWNISVPNCRWQQTAYFHSILAIPEVDASYERRAQGVSPHREATLEGLQDCSQVYFI